MVRFDALVEAIHYISAKAAHAPEQLDQIKLNKVLWYADARSYMRTGSSITGTTYLRKPFGPVARGNRPAVGKLEEDGILRRGKVASGSGHWNTHFDLIEPFVRKVLTEGDIEIVDSVYESVVGHTSMGVSERTHGEVWELADRDERLPLYTVFAEHLGEVTDEHMKLAREGL